MRVDMSKWVSLVGGLIAALLLVSVACSQSTQRMADTSEREGDWDQAVLYYLELVENQPENISFRAALMRARIRSSQMHFELGKEFKDAGVLDQAMIELQQAVQLDTTNQYAQVELRKVREEIATASGGAEVLRNGNVLIVETDRGRVLEVTPDKRVVWELRSPYRVGERDDRVEPCVRYRRRHSPGWPGQLPGG